jgi:poly-gamma-glutamate synthesis protein (capsule biosynthesis protein)
MKSYIKYSAPALLFLLLLFDAVSCTVSPSVKTSGINEPAVEASGETAAVQAPAEHFLTIIAAGDNLYQDPILKEFNVNGVYDFSPLYEHISGYIDRADIAFVNQETIFGPREKPASGYPFFNTPSEAGIALAAVGFDVINHATNHALDMGEAGIISTLDFWETRPEIHSIGIYRSEDDRKNRNTIIEKNNIRVGFLAYTWDTNGIPLPKNKPWLVSIADRETMADEIDALRPLCDFLIVSMHWGNEYQQEPSPAQRELAAFLADHNADLIIGHHPHVLQPIERLQKKDGGETVCFYSLGNFIAAHAMPNKETLLGGLGYIKLKKSGGVTGTVQAGLVPVITHYEKSRTAYRVYPLDKYTVELAARHEKKPDDADFSTVWFKNAAEKMFGTDMLFYNPLSAGGSE